MEKTANAAGRGGSRRIERGFLLVLLLVLAFVLALMAVFVFVFAFAGCGQRGLPVNRRMPRTRG